MPELTEVETVVRQLKPALRNKRIISLRIIDPLLQGVGGERVSDTELQSVQRIGKQIVLELLASSGERCYLAVHLRMTGRLIWKAQGSNDSALETKYVNKTSLDQKHLRAEITFEGGTLSFFDARRFGTLKVATSIETFLPKGVEPYSDDYTLPRIEALLKNSKQSIKMWLLRQDKIVGLGNIYACEILFDAKLHPLRIAGELKKSEIKTLFKSCKKILDAAIENCGTTFSDFQDSSGELGEYQHYLLVYKREGQPCSRGCGTIMRLRQQGRSTFYCPTCQI